MLFFGNKQWSFIWIFTVYVTRTGFKFFDQPEEALYNILKMFHNIWQVKRVISYMFNSWDIDSYSTVSLNVSDGNSLPVCLSLCLTELQWADSWHHSGNTVQRLGECYSAHTEGLRCKTYTHTHPPKQVFGFYKLPDQHQCTSI